VAIVAQKQNECYPVNP